jgi:hypothetical protein
MNLVIHTEFQRVHHIMANNLHVRRQEADVSDTYSSASQSTEYLKICFKMGIENSESQSNFFAFYFRLELPRH